MVEDAKSMSEDRVSNGEGDVFVDDPGRRYDNIAYKLIESIHTIIYKHTPHDDKLPLTIHHHLSPLTTTPKMF